MCMQISTTNWVRIHWSSARGNSEAALIIAGDASGLSNTVLMMISIMMPFVHEVALINLPMIAQYQSRCSVLFETSIFSSLSPVMP